MALLEIVLVVDVDTASWAANRGTLEAEVPEDVRSVCEATLGGLIGQAEVVSVSVGRADNRKPPTGP